VELVPVTVAEKVAVPPGLTDTLAGDTDTVMAGGAVTVTTALPEREESATLVASTWKVPALLGAV
jgi:hypothetical protein